jgi:hypothetical protein
MVSRPRSKYQDINQSVYFFKGWGGSQSTVIMLEQCYDMQSQHTVETGLEGFKVEEM